MLLLGGHDHVRSQPTEVKLDHVKQGSKNNLRVPLLSYLESFWLISSFLPSYKGSKNKPLTGKRESREQRAEREDKDYNTHLANISSAGQGLCNN